MMGWGGGCQPGWRGPGDTGSAPPRRVKGMSGEGLWSWQVPEGLSRVFLSCLLSWPWERQVLHPLPGSKAKVQLFQLLEGEAGKPLPVEQPCPPPCCQHWGLTRQLPFGAVILCIFIKSGVFCWLAVGCSLFLAAPVLLQVLSGCHSQGLQLLPGHCWGVCCSFKGPRLCTPISPTWRANPSWIVASQAGAVLVPVPGCLCQTPNLGAGALLAAGAGQQNCSCAVGYRGVRRLFLWVPGCWDAACSGEEAGLQWECWECDAAAVWGSVGSWCVADSQLEGAS